MQPPKAYLASLLLHWQCLSAILDLQLGDETVQRRVGFAVTIPFRRAGDTALALQYTTHLVEYMLYIKWCIKDNCCAGFILRQQRIKVVDGCCL